MKSLVIAATLLSMFTGAALAQDVPPPPLQGAEAGPDNGPRDAPRPPRHGPKEEAARPGPREGRDGPPPPPSKAGHIRADLGNGRGIDVKCPDDEPMKACADLANALLDKVAARP